MIQSLIQEFQALTPLTKLTLILTIGGVSATSIFIWLMSLTKLGRARKIEAGLRAELEEARISVQKVSKAAEKASSELQLAKASGWRKVLSKERSDGNLERFNKLLFRNSSEEADLSAIYFEKALYQSSLIPGSEPEALCKTAMKTAFIAFYLSQGNALYNSLATDLSQLCSNLEVISKIFSVSVSDDWIGTDSDPELIIGHLAETSNRARASGFWYVALALTERAYFIARHANEITTETRVRIANLYLSDLNLCQFIDRLRNAARMEREWLASLPHGHITKLYDATLDVFEGEALSKEGSDKESYELMKRGVARLRAGFPEGDEKLLAARMTKARVADRLGIDETGDLVNICTVYDKEYGPNYVNTLTAQFFLARSLYLNGKIKESQALASKILPLKVSVKGGNHRDTQATKTLLGVINQSMKEGRHVKLPPHIEP